MVPSLRHYFTVIPAGEASLQSVCTGPVRRAFGQRRKKLANALKSLEAGKLLAELGLANLRAEEVAVADYIGLSNRAAAGTFD